MQGPVEVVIPAWNATAFLREALASVAAQDAPPLLVTVVNDRSTDGTVALALSCAAEFAGRIAIDVIDNAGPPGPSAARNTALRRSQAEWIALLDADDLLTPSHHATLLQVSRSGDGVVLGFGNSTVFAEEAAGTREIRVPSALDRTDLPGFPATELAPEIWTLEDAMFNAMLRHGVFGTSACLFRRTAALEAGGFDETMMHGEDTDLFLRLSLAGRFAFTRTVVTHKRVHAANLSHARNYLAFCRGTAMTLAKLEAMAGLDAIRAQDVAAALTDALESYLYNASLAGPAAYLPAMALALQSGRAWRAARLRHLARLLLVGLRARSTA